MKESIPYDGQSLEVPEGPWRRLAPTPDPRPALVGEALFEAVEAAADRADLADHLQGAARVGVLLPDGTRKAAIPEVLPELLAAIEARAPDAEVTCFLACGAHRPPDPDEVARLTGGVAAHPIHAYRDGPWVERGVTTRGTPVALAGEVMDQDALVSLGSVKHHYFAGFGGGPKFLVPGVARIDTLEANHALAFGEQGGMRAGVHAGSLVDNPLHADIREAAALGPPLLSFHVALREDGGVAGLVAGVGLPALEAAAEDWARTHRPWKDGAAFDLVLASAGAAPDDCDLVQAHKGLDASCALARPGGEIFFAAACPEGAGPAGALELLDLGDPAALAARMRERFELRGVFAWNVLAKARAFRIHLLSQLDPARVEGWGMVPFREPETFLAAVARAVGRSPDATRALLPAAGRTMPPRLEAPCWIS